MVVPVVVVVGVDVPVLVAVVVAVLVLVEVPVLVGVVRTQSANTPLACERTAAFSVEMSNVQCSSDVARYLEWTQSNLPGSPSGPDAALTTPLSASARSAHVPSPPAE